MKLGIPEFILTAIILIKLGVQLTQDYQKAKNNFIGYTSSLLVAAIELLLLWWGGFYD